MTRFLFGPMAMLAAMFAAPAEAHGADLDRARPWESVVRIRVDLGQKSIKGQQVTVTNFGSGTTVVGDPNNALIVTCAHTFEDEGRLLTREQLRGRMLVETFDGKLDGPKGNKVKPLASYPGDLVAVDPIRDVAVVRFAPPAKVPASVVAAPDWIPTADESLITVGCPKGYWATAWNTTFMEHFGQVNGWEGYRCRVGPFEGRSGGGLFNAKDELVAVCDYRDGEVPGDTSTGLYASIKSVYAIMTTAGINEAQFRRWRVFPQPQSTCPAGQPCPQPTPQQPVYQAPQREPIFRRPPPPRVEVVVGPKPPEPPPRIVQEAESVGTELIAFLGITGVLALAVIAVLAYSLTRPSKSRNRRKGRRR